MGENAGVVGAGRVETVAAHVHAAAAHAEAFEVAVVDDGAAAGEGDAGRIDKAAAVYLNAGGVGHNHFGAPAGHFDIAAQLRYCC